LKIVDLTPYTIDDSISLCIGSKPGFEQAREEKRRWLEERLPNRVGVKLAYQDGSLAGMIEYSPIEDTPFPVDGKNLLHIHCVWVLPNFQKMRIGNELVKAVVNEARIRGRRGVSVIAHDGAFFMPISFFTHEKFRTVDRRDHSELMWRELDSTNPPKFVNSSFSPTVMPGKVSVDVLYCSQCPWTIKSRERITKISREFGSDVKVHTVKTDDRKVMQDTGDVKGVYVNGQDFFFAATEDDIRKMLAAKTRLLHGPGALK
jgi:predicted N-acetyltransferase YhbS